MKRNTINRIAIALQVLAVIFLFGYNGCSSNTKIEDRSAGNVSVITFK